MAGFVKKAAPWVIGGPIGGALYNSHRKSRSRKNRREKAGRRAERKAEERDVRHLKKDRKDEQAYNKKYDKSEQQANSKLDKFLGKYGAEKFSKKGALSGHQRSLLDQLSQTSKKGIRNQRAPEDIYDIRKERGFKQGQRGLQNMLENPGVSQIEDFQPYQQGVQGIQDLLSNDGQAYKNFEDQALQDYNQKVLPSIANRYAGQGAGGLSSSGFQNQLKESGNDLTTRLRALRSGLQQQGRQEALQYGQAGLPGQQLRSGIQQQAIGGLLNYAQSPLANETAQAGNIFAQNQEAQRGAEIGLRTNPYTNIYRPASYSQGIVSGGPAPVPRSPGMAPAPVRQTAPSALQQIGGAVLPAAGAAAGSAFGGPIGGAVGGAFANSINGAFK